ncbi:MAG: dihydroneopterin aldolase [Bacteroidales bacterium]|nr:dihydroneopterin aldolase [Bacteroidales bacterium]
MARITIDNMSFYAFHGCFDEESKIGTNFSIDCEFDCDTKNAEISDNIEDTVSYLDVYKVIKQQMEIPSHLLEHVSRRIIDALFESFPQIDYCKIRVHKLNPPLGGQMKGVSVCLERYRS